MNKLKTLSQCCIVFVVAVAFLLLGQSSVLWYDDIPVALYTSIDVGGRILIAGGVLLLLKYSSVNFSVKEVPNSERVWIKVILIVLVGLGFHVLKHPISCFDRLFDLQYGENHEVPYKENTIALSTLIRVVIVTPVMEELLFRGYMLRKLLSAYSNVFSVILMALLFSLFHFPDISSMINAFLFGSLAGLLITWGYTLGLTILLHFVVNLLWYVDSVHLHMYRLLTELFDTKVLYVFALSLTLVVVLLSIRKMRELGCMAGEFKITYRDLKK